VLLDDQDVDNYQPFLLPDSVHFLNNKKSIITSLILTVFFYEILMSTCVVQSGGVDRVGKILEVFGEEPVASQLGVHGHAATGPDLPPDAARDGQPRVAGHPHNLYSIRPLLLHVDGVALVYLPIPAECTFPLSGQGTVKHPRFFLSHPFLHFRGNCAHSTLQTALGAVDSPIWELQHVLLG